MYDTAIVGAGPAGCVAAIALARRGARVALLEGNPGAPRRLAGEWLHPPGREVLERLGVAAVPTMVPGGGRGFVVFPGDRSAPIRLFYGRTKRALTAEHSAIVGALRAAARREPLVTFLPSAVCTSVEEDALEYASPQERGPRRVRARVIVGADGKSSLVRRALGLDRAPERRIASHMAGVLLEDVTLPFEGMGHVIAGAPGPILAYRVSPREARVCIDVPLDAPRDAEFLREAYAPWVPEELRAAFVRALERGPISWAALEVRARRRFGRGRFALLGDAVGTCHPISAVGMTVSLLDAECLARSETLEAFRAERAARSRVPETLAGGLYELFTRRDPGSESLRQAVYEVWRTSPIDRLRTMRLLSGEDVNRTRLRIGFLRMVPASLRRLAQEAGRARSLRPVREAIVGIRRWVSWLAAVGA
jgi:2-polyprenyl-6-methoxyphenol hydroxylase-like FAD-dependent oxidoreductase